MELFIKNKKLVIIFLSLIATVNLLYGQISCTLIDMPQLKSIYTNPLNIATDVSIQKTVRVNIHFILKSDGTGNFTEARDIYNVQNMYNGYWFADKVIEQCNYWLDRNQTMTQQLSCCPIPVQPTNYRYTLAGVFFDKNDTYFNTPDIYTNLIHNGSDVINILAYPNGWGNGSAIPGGNLCQQNGVKKAYDDYLAYGDWGIYNGISFGINHEVGHCLSLQHSKRSSGGQCCTSNLPTCLDNCMDTPTYQELIADGYSDPCAWGSGQGYSNNIMDYGPLEEAFTPCQIENVHTHIDFFKNYFKYGVFRLSTASINSFSDNETYIASTITIPIGVSITIPNGKRLFLDAQQLEILGQFEVPLGSTFEFKPYGM